MLPTFVYTESGAAVERDTYFVSTPICDVIWFGNGLMLPVPPSRVAPARVPRNMFYDAATDSSSPMPIGRYAAFRRLVIKADFDVDNFCAQLEKMKRLKFGHITIGPHGYTVVYVDGKYELNFTGLKDGAVFMSITTFSNGDVVMSETTFDPERGTFEHMPHWVRMMSIVLFIIEHCFAVDPINVKWDRFVAVGWTHVNGDVACISSLERCENFWAGCKLAVASKCW